MNSFLRRHFSKPVTTAFAFAALLLYPASQTQSAPLPLSLGAKVFQVHGQALNTITNLIFTSDVTLDIESVQVGHLSHFGNFTGAFSYKAVVSPATINLLGTATLTNDHGEKLFITATVVELGTDYPRTLVGTLVVTGGTGRFLEAKGALRMAGIDEESLTDLVTFDGRIIIPPRR